MLSYLLFAREFLDAMMDLGRVDARRWLAGRPAADPWRCEELPDGSGPPRGEPARRRARPAAASRRSG